jgi:probable F420-dependent oxidoreductase
MTRPFGLGINLPYVERSAGGATPRWSDIRAMALTAEEMGFDAIWVSDHVGFTQDDGSWHGAWEVWTLLSALAAATERVELGTYVLSIPYRNPALLAKMAETLDEVSGGRLILGIGAGWNEPEFVAYDFPFDDRFVRFEDAIRIITSMLRGGRADHDGRVVSARGAHIRPRGPRPGGLPVMVGTSGPRMLRLTAELADHWNGGLRSVDEVPGLIERVDAACRDVGRDPATLARSVEILVRTVADGSRPAERELRGTPDELADAIRRFEPHGLAHVQVQLRPNTLEGLRAFGPVLAALDA